MQFMVSYSIDIPQRDAAEARFLETGATPPDGVQMIGRWHCTGERRGYMVLESTEITNVMKFMRAWNDVLNFQITPVVSDAQLAETMRS